jgi:hypothetical protein
MKYSICIEPVFPATDSYPVQEMVLVFSASKPWTYLASIGFSSCTGAIMNNKCYF